MAKAKPVAPAPDQTTAVAKPKGTAVGQALDFARDAGAGFENAGREAFAIPFLTILQSGSPQCKKSDGAYIKGASEGMLYNSVTNEIFDGDEGVLIVPAAFVQTFVEWKLRESGGGFVAEYDAPSGTALRSQCVRDDKNRDIMRNKNQLNDTRNHYVIYQDADGNWQPALMSMTSTQIKASRNWMSDMQRKTGTHKAPMFGLVYRVTTVAQSNDKGSWYGYNFEFEHLVDNADVYETAKAFYQQVKSGAVRISPREMAPDAASAGDGFSTEPDDM